MYVGSDDHRVRPFLRVGTSPHLPDRIRPYIGTVVLSDRVTGNPLQEADTVGAVGPRRPEYTGSPELVHAFSPLTGMDRVQERPISSSERQLPQGAFVEFLTDGNLHLTVNGHRIYDLDEVERNDRHAAYLLDRVGAAVRGSGGAYAADVFQPEGFLVGTDRSTFRFSQGQLTATALQSGAVTALARRLIQPEWLEVVAGPADPDELLKWGKWRLRGALLDGASRPMIVSQAAGSDEPRRMDHLLDVLRVAGVPLERAPVSREFDLSGIPGEPDATTLRVSGRGEWPAVPAEILDGVPLVPGVPYRVFGGFEAIPSGDAAGVDPAEMARGRDDAYGKLMNLLHGWNTTSLSGEDAKPEQFVQRAGELLAVCPAPVFADLYPSGEGYTVRFMVQHGFSLKFARENLTALERIDTALRDSDEDGEFFRRERRRLLALLDELLEQRRATTRAPSPAPEPTPDSDSRSSGAPQTPPERNRSAETTSAASSSDSAPDDRHTDDRHTTDSSRNTAGSPHVPRTGGAAGTHDTRRTAADSAVAGSGRRKWRGPVFVVVGVILIAGAVALLLWRDDTGEGYLARLGSQSEAALSVDGEIGGDPGGADEGQNGGDPGGADDSPDGGESAAPGGTDADGEPMMDDAGGDDGSGVDDPSIGGSTDQADSDSPPTTDTTDSDSPPTTDTTDTGNARNESISSVDTGVSSEAAPSDQATAVSTGSGEGGEAGEDGEAPIRVTVTDILRMVNRIARLNGYAPIGSMAPDARDPDWIFPGNELELPNQRLYEIRRGDTMWAIADRFIQQSAQEHNRALADLTERIQQGERPTEELQVLLDEAYVETTRRRAGELLAEIGVE
jgi:hypothetical protein